MSNKQAFKKSKPLVSIIMPVLNGGKYFEKAIGSVCNQSLNTIEIIIVDGGSTDGTLDIVNKNAKEDDRIVLLEAQKKSMGYQYNIGIKEAQGEYIGFVESDDFVDEKMYEELYKVALREKVDMVKADYWLYREENQVRSSILENIKLYNRRFDFVPRETVILKGVLGHWSGIYKKKYLVNNGIYFNETPGASYQDIGFYHLSSAIGGSIYYKDCPYYFYRRDNPDSSIKVAYKRIFYVNEFDYLLYELRNRNLLQEYGEVFAYYFFTIFRSGLGMIAAAEREEVIKKISKEYLTLRNEGFCNERYFSAEELELLDEMIKEPEKYLIGQQQLRQEYIYQLSQIDNLIIVGKGMVADMILRKLPAENKMIANITSDEIDKVSEYKNDGFFLVAVRNKDYREDIVNILIRSGIKKYDLVPEKMF